jgi:hypothetical protein
VSAEKQSRCRFWPHCRVHLGFPRPPAFSDDNRTEMTELHGEGWKPDEIAAYFGTWPDVVTDILKGTHHE